MGHRARVTVSFVMDYEAGTWGDDCSLGQLRKQAEEEALEVARAVRGVVEASTAPSLRGLRLRIEGIRETHALIMAPPKDRG